MLDGSLKEIVEYVKSNESSDPLCDAAHKAHDAFKPTKAAGGSSCILM